MRRTCLTALLFITLAATALVHPPRAAAVADDEKPEGPQRWESTIRKFQEQDEKDPFPKGGVVFVGSSSIRMWKLDKWFPKLQPLNRGFGGSEVADSLYYAEQLVLKHQPRTIVMYAGDNDIAKGKTPQRVFDDFKAFVKKVHASQPRTKIVYIAIKPSIARWNLVGKMREANKLIREYTEKHDLLTFADIDTPMIGDDGKPREELFVKDGLHLSEKGYEIWTGVVREKLSE